MNGFTSRVLYGRGLNIAGIKYEKQHSLIPAERQ